jgi:hypothetical protein
MIVKPKHDPNDYRDHDDQRDHDNDNDNERAVAPAPSGGALALVALGKTLNAVDTTSVIGGGGMPMLSFKREGDGTYVRAAADHRRRRQPLGRESAVVSLRLHLLRRRQQGAR